MGLRTCVDDGNASIDDVYTCIYVHMYYVRSIDRSPRSGRPYPYGHRAIAYNIMINRLSAEYSPGRSGNGCVQNILQ